MVSVSVLCTDDIVYRSRGIRRTLKGGRVLYIIYIVCLQLSTDHSIYLPFGNLQLMNIVTSTCSVFESRHCPIIMMPASGVTDFFNLHRGPH